MHVNRVFFTRSHLSIDRVFHFLGLDPSKVNLASVVSKRFNTRNETRAAALSPTDHAGRQTTHPGSSTSSTASDFDFDISALEHLLRAPPPPQLKAQLQSQAQGPASPPREVDYAQHHYLSLPLRQLLWEFYRPYNQALETLLGHKPPWAYPSRSLRERLHMTQQLAVLQDARCGSLL